MKVHPHFTDSFCFPNCSKCQTGKIDCVILQIGGGRGGGGRVRGLPTIFHYIRIF